MMLPPHPNATESMAERAWRYGEQGVPHWAGGGYLWFIDGSAMSHWQIESRRSLHALRDRVDAWLDGTA